MVYVFLANGFEDIEALTVVDILRRADIDTRTVGIGGRRVTSTHGVTVEADLDDTHADADAPVLAVLPGGQPGADNLGASDFVSACVDSCIRRGALVAAICAAPMALGRRGLLDGKKATCYPGCEGELGKAVITGGNVVRDGGFITSRGPATAAEFAFALVELISGRDSADAIRKGMLFC